MCFFVAGVLVMDLDLWEERGIVKQLGQTHRQNERVHVFTEMIFGNI